MNYIPNTHILSYIPIDKLGEYIYNDANISLLKEIILMLREKKSDPYYTLKSSNLTLLEELFFERVTDGLCIDDNLQCAMMKGNIRVIYAPDAENIELYERFRFTVSSKIKENEYNYFTTFVVGNIDITNNTSVVNLCLDILNSKLSNYFHLDSFDGYTSDESVVLRATAFVTIYLNLFKTLDECFNLKYSDFDAISTSTIMIFDPSYFYIPKCEAIVDVIKDIYINAIEMNYKYKIKDIVKRVLDIMDGNNE